MKKEANYLKKDEPDVFAPNTCGRYQQFLWDLMEKPDTSIAAKVRANGIRVFAVFLIHRKGRHLPRTILESSKFSNVS